MSQWQIKDSWIKASENTQSLTLKMIFIAMMATSEIQNGVKVQKDPRNIF